MAKLIQDKQSRDAQERTRAIIEYFKGIPGEFMMLKGLLCMDHPFEGDARREVTAFIDGMMIAHRMDEITATEKAAALASIETFKAKHPALVPIVDGHIKGSAASYFPVSGLTRKE